MEPGKRPHHETIQGDGVTSLQPAFFLSPDTLLPAVSHTPDDAWFKRLLSKSAIHASAIASTLMALIDVYVGSLNPNRLVDSDRTRCATSNGTSRDR